MARSPARGRSTTTSLAARPSAGHRGGRPPQVTSPPISPTGAGAPRLDLVFDTSGARHPRRRHRRGARPLRRRRASTAWRPARSCSGSRSRNSAQGGITTTGSMVRAMDYAIRFAEARRHAAGAQHELRRGQRDRRAGADRPHGRFGARGASRASCSPSAPATTGPGLSTIGFPGSARRGPSPWAPRYPGALSAARSRAARASTTCSRTSAPAAASWRKPDLVDAGRRVFSTVPRWTRGRGDQAGHQHGLAPCGGPRRAARLGAQSRRSAPSMRATHQAGAHGHRPAAAGRHLHRRGHRSRRHRRGVSLARAGDPVVRISTVRAVGPAMPTARCLRRSGAARGSPVQQFELLRPAGAHRPATRSGATRPGSPRPATVTLRGPAARHGRATSWPTLSRPAPHVGTVTGWGADTLAGPAFRLVTTVVAPRRVTRRRPAAPRRRSGASPAARCAPSSGPTAARPFALTVATGGRAETGARLPARAAAACLTATRARRIGGSRTAGSRISRSMAATWSPATYEVGAWWRLPSQALSVGVSASSQSPLTLRLSRAGRQAVAASCHQRHAGLRGRRGRRCCSAARRGSRPSPRAARHQRIAFVVPAWAKGVVVDVTMDRAQWDRFTDFGVTLFDSARPADREAAA